MSLPGFASYWRLCPAIDICNLGFMYPRSCMCSLLSALGADPCATLLSVRSFDPFAQPLGRRPQLCLCVGRPDMYPVIQLFRLRMFAKLVDETPAMLSRGSPMSGNKAF